MKVVRISQVPHSPHGEGTGSTRQILVTPDSKDFSVNLVHWNEGVRGKLHSHDHDQVLIIAAGRGVIANEREERIVTTGDVVFVPPGEVHLHGAAKDSKFSYFSIRVASGQTAHP